jgi:transmembrane sensor
MNSEFAESSTPVSEQAAAWYFELADGPNDWQTRQEFVRWLKRSPQHIDCFLSIAMLEQELSELPGDLDDALALVAEAAPNTVSIADAANSPGNTGRHRTPRLARRGVGWLAAAGIAGMAIVAALPFVTPDDASPGVVHKTDFGEQRSIALGDGSIVILNTLSEIAVRYDDAERRVELLSGEAMFDVTADNQRPFIVETGAVALNVLGTRFSVYRTSESIRLAVVEGVVSAVPRQRPEGQILVKAGEGAIATPDGTIRRNDALDVDKAIAWTERRLIFDDVPLENVVLEFNRYNRRPLIVQDPRLGQRKITSVFFANDVSALVAFLELDPDVEVDYGADAIRIRSKH